MYMRTSSTLRLAVAAAAPASAALCSMYNAWQEQGELPCVRALLMFCFWTKTSAVCDPNVGSATHLVSLASLTSARIACF